MKTYPLIIASPDGTVFQGDIVKITLRGANGDLAVLAGHIPFITSVQDCDCKLEFKDGTEKIAHTNGGLLTVSADKVTLLSGSFTWKNN